MNILGICLPFVYQYIESLPINKRMVWTRLAIQIAVNKQNYFATIHCLRWFNQILVKSIINKHVTPNLFFKSVDVKCNVKELHRGKHLHA